MFANWDEEDENEIGRWKKSYCGGRLKSRAESSKRRW
jgi:hypothetical protein